MRLLFSHYTRTSSDSGERKKLPNSITPCLMKAVEVAVNGDGKHKIDYAFFSPMLLPTASIAFGSFTHSNFN